MTRSTVAISLLLLGLVALPGQALPYRTSNAARIARTYRDLTLDQPLDRAKLDRLVTIALENDLLIDKQEAAALQRCLAQGYDDPTGDGPPEFETTLDQAPLKGWTARAHRLLVSILHASLLSNQGRRALRELSALALREDLTPDDRTAILDLIDRFREVDTAQRSRDLMEGLAVLVANPEQARADRAHRHQLKMLERLTNSPLWVAPAQTATASKVP